MIPIYSAILIDDDCGMERISLVDSPAVESDFVALAEQKKPVMLRVEDEEKRLIRGVVMRADFPIYRYCEKMGEYYLVFSPETIRKMAEKYLAENRQNLVNQMHKQDSDVEGVQMVQYFIKDVAAGVSPVGFEEIEDGSLFAEFHVINDEVWAEIKTGNFKGFSLEGVFSFVPQKTEEKNNKQTKSNSIMSKLNKIKEAVKELMAKMMLDFTVVTTDKGLLEWDGDEDLKQGDKVYIPATEEGEQRKAAEDGDYTTEDGKVIKVVDGAVAEIVDTQAEVDGAEEQPNEDEPNREDDGRESRNEEIGKLREEVNELYKLVDSLLKAVGITRDEAEQMRADIKELKEKPAAKPANEEFEEQRKPTEGLSDKQKRTKDIMTAKRVPLQK